MNTINQYNYTNTPAFGASYKSKFSRHLEHTLLTGDGSERVVQEFDKILKTKKNISAKMGQGKYGEVFRIDDFYVFKSYFDQQPNPDKLKLPQSSPFKKLKTYFGSVVARIGNIEIIRNVTKNTKNFLQMPNVKKEGVQAFNQALKEFAELPQQAFDNLAHDYDHLNKLRNGHIFYMFDTANPNNFIKVGKSIRVVDDIDWVPCEKPNTLYHFLKIFLQEDGDIALKKQLFKKCILAAEKYQLPMDTDYKYLKSHVEELFKNAHLNQTFEQYYQKMTEIRSIPDKNTRMQLVTQYLETL